MSIQRIPPANPIPGMSAAVVANGFVFVAGQVPSGPDGLVGEGDSAAQTRQCFANIEQVLAQAGCGMSDIVAMTAFLVHPSHSKGFFSVRQEVFADAAPATTTICGVQLSDARYLLEVQVTAVVPQ